jgi:hypothetical protein
MRHARIIALSVGLAAVAIGALVVVTRAPDAHPELVAATPITRPPAPPSRDAAIDAPPVAVAADAAMPAASDAPEALWPVAGSGAMVGMVPPGPFETLDTFCRAHHAGSDDCKASEQEVESGPFTAIGSVELAVGSANELDGGTSTMYAAVKASAGWYAMPLASLMMLNRTGFNATPLPAGDALVIEYRKSEGNRFDNDTEEGITVCKPVAGAVACTPQIPLRKRTDTIETKPDNWTASVSVALACVATYANGAVTVAAMPKPDPTEPDDWDAAAAARCNDLPYGGTRRVTFRK